MMNSAAILRAENETARARLKELATQVETRSLTSDESDEVSNLKSKLEDTNKKLEQIEYLQSVKETRPPADNEDMDFQQRSRNFCVSKLIQKAAGKSVDIGSEQEISDELKRSDSLACGDYLMPFDALETRTIATDADLHTDTYQPQSFIQYLRNTLVSGQAGIQIMRGGSSDIKIPRQTNTTKVRWLAETGTATNDVDLAFDSVRLTPKKLMGLTSWTAQAALESNPSIEQICRADMMAVIAQELDRVFLYGAQDTDGQGAANANKDLEPVGVTKLVAAKDATTAGAKLTYATVLSMISELDDANIMGTRRCFITNYKVMTRLMQDVRFANTDSATIYQGGQIAGQPTYLSNVVRSNNSTSATPNTSNTTGSDIFYMNASDYIQAIFGQGISLLLNEYGTGYTSGAVQLRSILFADGNARYSKFANRYQKVVTA